MKFIRKSLARKASVLFILLAVLLTAGGIALFRRNIMMVRTEYAIAAVGALLLFFLIIFMLDVVMPIKRVAKQVGNLLTGKQYERLKPASIDELGMFTHFFNVITEDLEKVSHDLKERKRMSSELDIASQIQKDVLPKEAPESPGLDIVAKTRSAAEVGGDCFDFLSSPDKNHTYIYIGDVTGHGVPAGLVMMMVDTLVQSMVSVGLLNSRDVIVNTNTLLQPRISTRLFMTLVMLRWDAANQKMFYTGAGHEHILIYHAQSEKVEAIKSGGIALGMIPDNSQIAVENEIPLQIGDSILLFTDGVTEAKNKTGEMYGLERLSASFEKYGFHPSAESIFDHVSKDFGNFVGEYVQADDITMICIKYVGRQASTRTKLSIAAEEETPRVSKIWTW